MAKILVPLVQIILAPDSADTIRQSMSKPSTDWVTKENGHYFARLWSRVNKMDILYEVAILETSIEMSLRNPFNDLGKQVITIYVLTLENDCVQVTQHFDGLSDVAIDMVSIIYILGSLSKHARKEETT
ncbi:hypothetical protein KBD68_04255 [Candidatus Woesebacteria bacterium]|nr:hypothetical protein [Candidatus Woesebacteria bacterium]